MRVRIGGVPEHFNLPWRLAIEEGLFAGLATEVEWVDQPGGTGAIMRAFEQGELDMATPLTEGAITAIANGNSSQLVRVWVDSPLMWGVHTSSSSTATSIEDLEGQRFAISRFGSGSELMALVMAQDYGWTLDDDSWVVVGGLDGAIESLPAGEAEIFLWDKTMTQPHVDDGTFARVGVYPTSWPSFSVACTTAMATDRPGLAETMTEIAAARAAALKLDDGAAALVSQRYGLQLEGALEWLTHVQFTPSGTPLDRQMVADVEARMRSVGRIR